jgi:hypothetical protein
LKLLLHEVHLKICCFLGDSGFFLDRRPLSGDVDEIGDFTGIFGFDFGLLASLDLRKWAFLCMLNSWTDERTLEHPLTLQGNTPGRILDDFLDLTGSDPFLWAATC